MSRRPLIDPRLKNALPTHWPSRCNIQSVNFTSSTSGQAVPTSGTDVLLDLECRLAAISLGTPTDDETRTSALTSGKESRTLLINGYYIGLIESDTMWAIVDGVTYHIRGVESDSEMHYTRLRLEAMTPNG